MRVHGLSRLLTFNVAILALCLIETVLILSRIMPKGFVFMHKEDFIMWTILGSTYLTCMTIAMYPGRNKPSVGGAYQDAVIGPQMR
jgi:hypothetical protein